MTTDTPTPWGQTTAGIVVINGVVTAVVSTLVTWIINNATSLPWLWIVTIFASVAVLVFVILSLFRARLRETIWKRPARWFAGLRITTAKQRLAEVSRAKSKAHIAANNAAKDLIAKAEGLAAEATRQNVDLNEENADLALKIFERTQLINALQASARGGESNALPRPDPRWRVYAEEDSADGSDFILMNSVPRSVAREVRIEADDDMEILDAGHWEDLSGDIIGSFRGTVTSRGWDYGVRIHIMWFDEKNERRSASVHLPGSEPAGTLAI